MAAKGEVGRLWIGFGAVWDDFDRSMRGMTKRLAPLQKKLTRTGRMMTRRITLPLIAAGAAIIRVGEELESGLANVSTLLLGDVTPRMKELREEVLKLSMDTGKSFEDLTGGLYEVISAFGDSANSMTKLQLAVKAGVAGVSTTKDAIKLLSAVTKAYGDISIKATEKVGDLAFETVRLGQTTFPELAATMGRVTGTAATLGVEVEELFAIFATLTGVTGDTAQVSTQADALLRALIKPTSSMTAAVRELGFATAESMVTNLGLVDSLRRLIGTTNGTQEAVGTLFTRAQALRGIFALTGAQSDVFEYKLAALRVGMGAMDRAFKKQMNTAKRMREQLRQTFLVAMVRISDALQPVWRKTIIPLLKDAADHLVKITEAFAALPEPVRRSKLALVAWAAAAGPIIWLLGKVVVLVGALKVAFAALAAFLIANPVGVIIAGIFVAIASLDKSLWRLNDEWKEHRKQIAETKAELAKMAPVWEDWEERIVNLHSELSTLNDEWSKVAAESLAQSYFERRVEAGLDPFGGAWKERGEEIKKQIAELEGKLKAIDAGEILPEEAAQKLKQDTAAQKMMEEAQAAYHELEKEMLSETDAEILAIQEKAAAYADAGVDRVTVSKYVHKKELELAQRLAGEQMDHLEELQQKYEETFKPRWFTPQQLARVGAEAGIEARFAGAKMGVDRTAVTEGTNESDRMAARSLKILDDIRRASEALVRLVQQNPGGVVA